MDGGHIILAVLLVVAIVAPPIIRMLDCWQDSRERGWRLPDIPCDVPVPPVKPPRKPEPAPPPACSCKPTMPPVVE